MTFSVIHMNCSMNIQIPIEMWQDINGQLEELMVIKPENFQICKTNHFSKVHLNKLIKTKSNEH